MKINGSLKISAPITPYDTEDIYPSHLAEYGKGGHRTVKTLTDRDLIPEERRELGMTVYVEEEKKIFCLQDGITNSNWINLETLLQGSDRYKIMVNLLEPTTPSAGDVWIDLTEGTLYLRDSDNRFWKPLTSKSVDGGSF